MENYVLIAASEDYSATDLEGIIYVSDSQPALVMIPIIVDDNILESNETFQVEIGILNTEDRKCIALQPNVVDITIMDDDSELSKILQNGHYFANIMHIVAVIGLNIPDNGIVTEGVDRSLDLNVEVISGELGLDVVVELVLIPGGTAKSMIS